MKIKCPHCRAVATIDDRKIPDTGLKAKCPRCGKRIVIRKKSSSNTDGQVTRPDVEKGENGKASGPEPSARPTSKKPSEREKPIETPGARLLRRIEKRQADRRGDDLEMEDELADLSVEVKIDIDPQYFLIGISIVVIIGFIVLMWWTNRIETDMPQFAPPVDQSSRGAGSLYGSTDMEAVIHRMRLKIRRDDYRPFWAPVPGPEERVLVQIMMNCRADCPEIEETRVAPLDTGDGFFAEVFCSDQNKYSITYYWSTNSAWIDERQCE